MRKYVAFLLLFGCVIWFFFVVYVNVDSIVGAYGSGPPYYDRTTNMDKWESPISGLVALDIASIAAFFLIGRWAYVQIRKR